MLTMTMTMPVSAEGDGIPDSCHKEGKQKTKLILGMVISFSLEEGTTYKENMSTVL